jgi:hypothetical protein
MVPPDNELVVTVGVTLLMVRLSCVVTETGVDAASVTFTVKPVVLAAVGVPEIAPAVLRASPAGSDDPDAKLQVSVPVPPVAASVAL